MKVIADVGNREYYRMRVVEELQNKGDIDSLILSIQLLVLSIAERENEKVHG